MSLQRGKNLEIAVAGWGGGSEEAGDEVRHAAANTLKSPFELRQKGTMGNRSVASCSEAENFSSSVPLL